MDAKGGNTSQTPAVAAEEHGAVTPVQTGKEKSVLSGEDKAANSLDALAGALRKPSGGDDSDSPAADAPTWTKTARTAGEGGDEGSAAAAAEAMPEAEAEGDVMPGAQASDPTALAETATEEAPVEVPTEEELETEAAFALEAPTVAEAPMEVEPPTEEEPEAEVAFAPEAPTVAEAPMEVQPGPEPGPEAAAQPEAAWTSGAPSEAEAGPADAEDDGAVAAMEVDESTSCSPALIEPPAALPRAPNNSPVRPVPPGGWAAAELSPGGRAEGGEPIVAAPSLVFGELEAKLRKEQDARDKAQDAAEAAKAKAARLEAEEHERQQHARQVLCAAVRAVVEHEEAAL